MPKKGKKKGRRHHHHVHHNHQGKGGHMRAARGHKRAAKFAHGANKKIHHLKAAQHRRKARAKQNKERRQRLQKIKNRAQKMRDRRKKNRGHGNGGGGIMCGETAMPIIEISTMSYNIYLEIVPEGQLIDTTGDGMANAVAVDTTGDGIVNTYIGVNNNGGNNNNVNNIQQGALLDTTGDGITNVVAMDTTGDGRYDTYIDLKVGTGLDTAEDFTINVIEETPGNLKVRVPSSCVARLTFEHISDGIEMCLTNNFWIQHRLQQQILMMQQLHQQQPLQQPAQAQAPYVFQQQQQQQKALVQAIVMTGGNNINNNTNQIQATQVMPEQQINENINRDYLILQDLDINVTQILYGEDTNPIMKDLEQDQFPLGVLPVGINIIPGVKIQVGVTISKAFADPRKCSSIGCCCIC